MEAPSSLGSSAGAPVDIKKLFNEELPAALAKNADDAKTIGAKFQMNITGPSGGEWLIDVSPTGPSCKAGTGEADCTITIADCAQHHHGCVVE